MERKVARVCYLDTQQLESLEGYGFILSFQLSPLPALSRKSDFFFFFAHLDSCSASFLDFPCREGITGLHLHCYCHYSTDDKVLSNSARVSDLDQLQNVFVKDSQFPGSVFLLRCHLSWLSLSSNPSSPANSYVLDLAST